MKIKLDSITEVDIDKINVVITQFDNNNVILSVEQFEKINLTIKNL